MTLLPSFESELLAFRKLVDDMKAELPEWEYRLALQVIARWRRHGDREEIWKKLRPKLRCPPAEFILQILRGRYAVEEVAQRLKQWPALEKKADVQVRRHMKQKHYDQAAEVNRRTHRFTQARAKFSRESVTVARQSFTKELSRVMQERCGQPFDWAVAALTEIAFGDEVSEEAARKARKNRSTDTLK